MLEPLDPTGWSLSAAAHLLNRAAFGGTPEDVSALHAKGLAGAVDSLLEAGEEADLFPAPDIEPMSGRMRAPRGESPSNREFEERKKMERMRSRREVVALRDWWLRRMCETPNPAREKATLFWHGHWATGIRKVRDPFLMLQQNETLRANALGPFARFAKSMTRDPAMIRYLDLQSSSAESPNENFAREVMELFTMGEGNYSEADVAEAARAFTGYRIHRETGGFRLDRRRADAGTKTVLGKTGRLTGDDVIDLIVGSPLCAEFLAGKIWTFYAGRTPPEPLRKALGREYQRQGMEAGKLLRTIFTSREFHASGVVRHQIKSPVQWLVQMCKTLGIPLPAPSQTQSLLSNLGQNLFDPPNAKGWEGGRAWIGSSTLLVRYNAAGQLLRRGGGGGPDIDRLVPPGRPPEQTVDELAWLLYQSPMPSALRERTMAFLRRKGASAPAARRDLLHLLMATPEYQLV